MLADRINKEIAPIKLIEPCNSNADLVLLDGKMQDDQEYADIVRLLSFLLEQNLCLISAKIGSSEQART